MDAIDMILDDTTQDLKISDGDFVSGDANKQHILHILQASRGQFYQSPLIGVGIISELASNSNVQFWKNRIETQLKADGYKVNNVQIDENFEIKIDALRIKQ